MFTHTHIQISSSSSPTSLSSTFRRPCLCVCVCCYGQLCVASIRLFTQHILFRLDAFLEPGLFSFCALAQSTVSKATTAMWDRVLIGRGSPAPEAGYGWLIAISFSLDSVFQHLIYTHSDGSTTTQVSRLTSVLASSDLYRLSPDIKLINNNMYSHSLSMISAPPLPTRLNPVQSKHNPKRKNQSCSFHARSLSSVWHMVVEVLSFT